ncbi:MAG: acyltransferase family protein, partial [Oscillospiraceae bacterium]|nr:acyltransferase family protein [Oscillospiraceae bacterium]
MRQTMNPKPGRRAAQRDVRFDNLRALLIFLVVFCHLNEAFREPGGNVFYLAVYSFHVPCLLFISGYFARFDPKKLIRRILLPY